MINKLSRPDLFCLGFQHFSRFTLCVFCNLYMYIERPDLVLDPFLRDRRDSLCRAGLFDLGEVLSLYMHIFLFDSIGGKLSFN